MYGGEECIEWIGCVGSRGYARVTIMGVGHVAHRVVYEMVNGPIPEGLVLDHLCRNKRCVNPSHLEPVTIAENVRRGYRLWSLRTHCKWGHEFTPENTFWHSRGTKMCKECKRRYAATRKAKKQQSASAIIRP